MFPHDSQNWRLAIYNEGKVTIKYSSYPWGLWMFNWNMYFKKNVLKWGICMTFCSNFKARERRFSIQTFRKCHSRTQIGSERHFWVSLQPSALNDNLRGPGWRPGQPRKLTQANNDPTVRYKLILDHLVQIYRLKNWLGLTMHTE